MLFEVVACTQVDEIELADSDLLEVIEAINSD